MSNKASPDTFNFSVSGGMEALSVLAGVRFHLMFTDLDAIITAYQVGLPIARELFGEDIPFSGPGWAGISYGHINCLGSQLIFPEDSEVAHTPVFSSLAEGVRALKKLADLDFTTAGLFSHYQALWEGLKTAFPALPIPFAGFGYEGPITTAWLLRGHDFFCDIYDDPPLMKTYLTLVTNNVIRFCKLLRRLNGWPEIDPLLAYVADDGAAMIPPSLWPEFVMPYEELYFSALTTGRRGLHIEDLHTDQLHYLDELRITSYDPSVSRRLTPALIRAHCRVPFSWRFNEIESAVFTPEETIAWVLDAARQGAPAVFCGIWRNNCTQRGAANFAAFHLTAQAVQQALAAGCRRAQLPESLGNLPGLGEAR